MFRVEPKPDDIEVRLKYANGKIKDLALCNARLDGALYSLSDQFATLVGDPASSKAQLAVNQIQIDADKAVDHLTGKYPSLGRLMAKHDGDTCEWEGQDDWIQMDDQPKKS